MILLVLLLPFPINESGTTVKYVAALWSFHRDYEVIEQDIGGNSGKVTYYTIYKFRVIFFPLEIKDTDHIQTAQW